MWHVSIHINIYMCKEVCFKSKNTTQRGSHLIALGPLVWKNGMLQSGESVAKTPFEIQNMSTHTTNEPFTSNEKGRLKECSLNIRNLMNDKLIISHALLWPHVIRCYLPKRWRYQYCQCWNWQPQCHWKVSKLSSLYDSLSPFFPGGVHQGTKIE